MNIPLQPEVPPLREDASGALRVGGTRVLLELVVHAFEDGASPEEIVQRYPTLRLADVYAVIAYYLHHRGDVEVYLEARARKTDEMKEGMEARNGDLAGIRARVRAASRRSG